VHAAPPPGEGGAEYLREIENAYDVEDEYRDEFEDAGWHSEWVSSHDGKFSLDHHLLKSLQQLGLARLSYVTERERVVLKRHVAYLYIGMCAAAVAQRTGADLTGHDDGFADRPVVYDGKSV
jgi:hypothetical protein